MNKNSTSVVVFHYFTKIFCSLRFKHKNIIHPSIMCVIQKSTPHKVIYNNIKYFKDKPKTAARGVKDFKIRHCDLKTYKQSVVISSADRKWKEKHRKRKPVTGCCFLCAQK